MSNLNNGASQQAPQNVPQGAPQVNAEPGYGFFVDEQRDYGHFGLNEHVKLVTFQHVPATGKDLTGPEALKVEFLFAGEEEPLPYYIYPVTQITYEDKEAGTKIEIKSYRECANDAQRKAWMNEMNKLSGLLTSILEVFMPRERVQASLSRPVSGFKAYIDLCATLLPKDFKQVPLDLFLQYKWTTTQKKDQEGNLTGEEAVYLEIPRTARQGLWLIKHREAQVQWKMKKLDPENTEDNVQQALWYEDAAGNIHPFKRSGYFIKSPWAKNLKERNGEMEGGSALANAASAAQGGAANTATETEGDW